jgi:hypothetical protein
MPSGQAAEGMDIPAQRDVVVLHVMTFHIAEGIVGAVLARAVEVGKVFEVRILSALEHSFCKALSGRARCQRKEQDFPKLSCSYVQTVKIRL